MNHAKTILRFTTSILATRTKPPLFLTTGLGLQSFDSASLDVQMTLTIILSTAIEWPLYASRQQYFVNRQFRYPVPHARLENQYTH